MKYCFSPYPMEHYKLQNLPACELTVIRSTEFSLETWNLFWLSNPAIDVVPVLGPRWWEQYRPNEGLLVNVMADVAEDEALMHHLTMHPDVFAEWFGKEDHSIFDCYDALGGRIWVETVLDRAEQAARHLMDEPTEANNVISLFRRRAA